MTDVSLAGRPLGLIHDALEGHIDSSRVALLARRIIQVRHFAQRTAGAWLALPYADFQREAAAYPTLAHCGPITYAEWQIALQCLCDGKPPSQPYPYSEEP